MVCCRVYCRLTTRHNVGEAELPRDPQVRNASSKASAKSVKRKSDTPRFQCTLDSMSRSAFAEFSSSSVRKEPGSSIRIYPSRSACFEMPVGYQMLKGPVSLQTEGCPGCIEGL